MSFINKINTQIGPYKLISFTDVLIQFANTLVDDVTAAKQSVTFAFGNIEDISNQLCLANKITTKVRRINHNSYIDYVELMLDIQRFIQPYKPYIICALLRGNLADIGDRFVPLTIDKTMLMYYCYLCVNMNKAFKILKQESCSNAFDMWLDDGIAMI